MKIPTGVELCVCPCHPDAKLDWAGVFADGTPDICKRCCLNPLVQCAAALSDRIQRENPCNSPELEEIHALLLALDGILAEAKRLTRDSYLPSPVRVQPWGWAQALMNIRDTSNS